MNEEIALDVARETIVTVLQVSAPIMMVGLVVGLVIAVFQALTQIQEATLTFVPKILAVFASMLFLIPFMLDRMRSFMAFVMDHAIGGTPGL